MLPVQGQVFLGNHRHNALLVQVCSHALLLHEEKGGVQVVVDAVEREGMEGERGVSIAGPVARVGGVLWYGSVFVLHGGVLVERVVDQGGEHHGFWGFCEVVAIHLVGGEARHACQ